MRDLYAEITDDIIASIEGGTSAFIMPWQGARSIGWPKNALTDGYYHGINLLLLMIRAKKAGYGEPIWATYRQWQQLDKQVAKGARGTQSILYKPMADPEDQSEDQPEDQPEDQSKDDASHDDASHDEEGRRRVFIRASYLFNIAQTEDYTPPAGQDLPTIEQISPVTRAEALVAATGAQIIIGGVDAQYEVSSDLIRMPDRARFDGRGIGDPTGAWYNTLLHELVHWTGAASRLDRPIGTGKVAARAFEELVAEIGSAFLMAELGIPNMPIAGYADYVANWLAALKNDKRLIFRAAAAAGKATEYLLAYEAQGEQRKQAVA